MVICFVFEDWGTTVFVQENFGKYVGGLLKLPSNESKLQCLKEEFLALFEAIKPNAFNENFGSTNKFELSREAEQRFQMAFQQFLVKTSGILCLK